MRMLRWIWNALLFGGAALLIYCGFILFEAKQFQERENRVLDTLLDERESAPLDTGARHSPPAAPVPSTVVKSSVIKRSVTQNGLIGRVEIPRLGLSEIVIEGSGRAALQRAAGHVPGTPLPGERGNTAITGHRDTFFRPLRNIRQGDLIRLTTLQGKYVYRVVSMAIVSPDYVEALNSDEAETLTLITCYPFNFVGAAPRRFIVRAERIQPSDTIQSSAAR